MKFQATSNMGGDCTTAYDVTDFPDIVADFVGEVLSQYPGEWGEFEIRRAEPTSFASIVKLIEVTTPVNFKYGKLLDPIPSELLTRRIKDVKASGGWSYMCYLLTLE